MSRDISKAVNYARRYLKDGVPEMHVREHFLRHGWSIEQVNHLFAQVYLPEPRTAVVTHGRTLLRSAWSYLVSTISRPLDKVYRLVRSHTHLGH